MLVGNIKFLSCFSFYHSFYVTSYFQSIILICSLDSGVIIIFCYENNILAFFFFWKHLFFPVKCECELCRILIASKVKSLVSQKTIYYNNIMISRQHCRPPDSVWQFVGAFLISRREIPPQYFYSFSTKRLCCSDSQNIVSS